MKLSDFSKVDKAYKIRANILNAISSLEDHLSEESKRDVGGIPGFDLGYSCHLSRYSDGSGQIVNMSGCYVEVEIAEASLKVLQKRLVEIEKALHYLGVTV